MANEVIARKQKGWKVVSMVPDVCKTPMGSSIVPVPYPVTAQLRTAVGIAKSVRANAKPFVVYEMSFTPKTIGDAAGRALGIASSTVKGKCHPHQHSKTVRAEGKHIVRHDDLFWMNGK